MSKTISIIDNDYKQWVKALVVRYRQRSEEHTSELQSR